MRQFIAVISALCTMICVGCAKVEKARQVPAPRMVIQSRTVFKTVKHPLANIAVLTCDLQDGRGPEPTQVIDFCPENDDCPVATGAELELMRRIVFVRTSVSHKCLAIYDGPDGHRGMMTPDEIDCAAVEHLLINK